MMVYRKRIGIWVIFGVACLVLQMVVPLIPSMAINFKQALLDHELKGIVEELYKVDEEVVVTEPIVNEDKEINDNSEMPNEEKAETAFVAILGIILMTGKYIGIMVVVFGVMNMVMGFKDENAEQMSRAISMMVLGSVLIGVGPLMSNLIGTPGAG